MDFKVANPSVAAGVKTGSRVRVAGEGRPGAGKGASGDLYLRIQLAPHATFEIVQTPTQITILYEYVHTLRMEEAKQMLESGDASIESIAFEVGYESESAFNRAFRRAFGVPPATWRKQAAMKEHYATIPNGAIRGQIINVQG